MESKSFQGISGNPKESWDVENPIESHRILEIQRNFRIPGFRSFPLGFL
jgi:hypothetical protein